MGPLARAAQNHASEMATIPSIHGAARRDPGACKDLARHCVSLPWFGIVGWLMPALNFDLIKRWILIITASGMLAPLNSAAEIIDYHQHLYSPEAGARSSPGPNGIDADYLVAQLDAAGIKRAVVLSVAYSLSNPNKPPVPNEYAHVMAENNWTSAQVARYPDRLLGFCSVNPLRP
jgi:hypothetical protein